MKNKISDTITTKSNLETTIIDKLQGKINEETEKFDSTFEKLKKLLKDDEIIIEIKKTNKLKVIKKIQLEMDKDLHISNSYIIRYKNNI
ncbi:hypothetical protein Lupro_08945 [Lutibacter profundi]|uniref:Uncharacterized protein n=1 Tax=Lutibacter profundi TaxID=1622118 RepID=A0A0X8G810_9FLAO|nr:hypothetical protein [Lutibacter profundi]AMC11378.1 hypothetical protein Lupro_08945 [Lutibacter profundi]